MSVLIFSYDDDEVIKVTYKDQHIARLDHDTLGWSGMDAAVKALKSFAEEAGISWVEE